MTMTKPRIHLRRGREGLSAVVKRVAGRDRLSELNGVRDNPGDLRGRLYVPAGLKGPAPLVVVLHGCTQDAAVYDHGSGWSTLADRHGFILLYPEQQRANNPMLCFNWFSGADTRRGMGEAASIRAMVEAVREQHQVDATRIFVTGLSAGGAMAAVMLATYPELFAAGAILAGVAYGCAEGVGAAFECMNGRSRSDAAELARNVRRATPHAGPWPRVQVWQGSADSTVVPSNAEAIVAQWTQLHGLAAAPDREDQVAGHPRRAWLGRGGEPLVEQYTITGMAHGVPLSGGGEDALGQAGAHMLDVGLSSTARIAAFFGIAPEEAARAATIEQAPRAAWARAGADTGARPRVTVPPQPASGPQAVIEQALRAAGLMR